MLTRRSLIWSAVITLLVPAPVRGEEQGPLIAAAADLKPVLPELVATFRSKTGQGARVVFGSSGLLATQIENGAPFELFLSADEAYVARLAGKGLTVGDGAAYAEGRLVLFAREDSPVRAEEGIAGLARVLREGSLSHVAIANPEHAPYGRAAREALEAYGLWDRLAPLLVTGENAAQAFQFAVSGAAEAGLVPYSLALAPEALGKGRWQLVPLDKHRPLRQRMVLINTAGGTARAFYDFMRSAEARARLARSGFVLPDE